MDDRFHLRSRTARQPGVAVLLLDVINDMQFEQGARLLRQALPAARKIAALTQRARAAGVPVVYVNDNFGHWQSDFKKQLDHCLHDGVRGEPVARLLAPEDDDYFVLKPKSSGFFETTLHTLLRYLNVDTLVLTGVAADVCVLFTAHDAHLLDYRIIVPSDCVAAESKRETTAALKNMEKSTKAVICRSSEIDFDRLRPERQSRLTQERKLRKAS